MSRLVRKQLYISEEQEQLLKRAARRGRQTEAEILRSALDQALRPKTVSKGQTSQDPLWDIIGLGRTGEGDVAYNVDHYLYGTSRR